MCKPRGTSPAKRCTTRFTDPSNPQARDGCLLNAPGQTTARTKTPPQNSVAALFYNLPEGGTRGALIRSARCRRFPPVLVPDTVVAQYIAAAPRAALTGPRGPEQGVGGSAWLVLDPGSVAPTPPPFAADPGRGRPVARGPPVVRLHEKDGQSRDWSMHTRIQKQVDQPPFCIDRHPLLQSDLQKLPKLPYLPSE